MVHLISLILVKYFGLFLLLILFDILLVEDAEAENPIRGVWMNKSYLDPSIFLVNPVM